MKNISVGRNLVAGTTTLMYTVPTGYYAKWDLLYAHNSTSSAKAFTAWWFDKSANTQIPIVENYPLPSKEYLKFNGGAFVVLEEGDEIRVNAEAGSITSCIVTVELVQKQATRLGV
jgi:hypothetical protein